MLRHKVTLEIQLTTEIWIHVDLLDCLGVAWMQKMVNPPEMMDPYALQCNQVHQRLEYLSNIKIKLQED